MIKATETLILKESFEYCPYIRAMQKEKRRNAEIKDEDNRFDREFEKDIPEEARLKAHLKRRVEKHTKTKWVQYATEYASEIVFSDSKQKDAMRKYVEMTRDSVMDMEKRDREKKKRRKEYATHREHAYE